MRNIGVDMSAKMNDFLLEYYKRLVFREMPIEQFVHFCEYLDADDMAGHMKSWKENLLELDPDDKTKFVKDAAGLYKRKNIPDPETDKDWKLSDEEWVKLFIAFNNAFQAMDANKKSFKYEDKPNKFLNKYFGNDGQLFSYATADDAAEKKIEELKKLLKEHDVDMRHALKEFFNDDFSWKDLMDGIDSKKYNTDPKFRQKIIDISGALEYDTKYRDPSPIKKMVGRELNFGDIAKGFETINIKSSKMTQFKLVHRDLLNELYTNKAAFKYFSAYDPTKISKSLNDAKEYLDYNNAESKDYISPKRPDELTLPQHISQWWDDTYSNYLEKYVKLSGDRMFFSPYAKAIFNEIDKAGVKPTDGLAKVLENTDKISGALKKKFKKAPDHFDWLIKTLTELKNTMGKGKAFEKALQNGNSLNAIVKEIILKAVNENEVEKAKTTLEVLAALRYTLTTSKIMDAFNKTDLTIFSDKNFSFNKNTGIQFVTSALDKGIKKTFQLFGYALTAAGNLIKRRGTKFRGKQDKRMQDAINAKESELFGKVERSEAALDKYKTELATTKEKLKGLGTEDALTKNVKTADSKVVAAENEFKVLYSNFYKFISGYEESGISDESTIDIINGLINNIETYGIKATFNAEVEKNIESIVDKDIREKALDFVKKARSIQSKYNIQVADLDAKKAKLQEFKDATSDMNIYNDLIESTTKEIEKLKKENLEKAKQIEELELFWNVCNSGTVKSFIGNKELEQKKFLNNAKAIYQKHVLDRL